MTNYYSLTGRVLGSQIMVKYIKILFFFCILFFTVQSCTVEEGEGGTSSVSGKVFVQDFNSTGFLEDEYYPGEWAVYIVYGDDEIYSDKFDTHFDGSFRFSSLYPGNYTIFTYSKCFPCPGEFEVKSVDIQLDRNEDLVLEDIVVID